MSKNVKLNHKKCVNCMDIFNAHLNFDFSTKDSFWEILLQMNAIRSEPKEKLQSQTNHMNTEDSMWRKKNYLVITFTISDTVQSILMSKHVLHTFYYVLTIRTIILIRAQCNKIFAFFFYYYF